MKIAIAGASGFVGRLIIPLLAKEGAELHLIGRDRNRLIAQYEGHACYAYEDLGAAVKDADLFLNLAVRNNDQAGTLNDFMDDNVAFTLHLLARAQENGVKRFVAASTVQTLMGQPEDPYIASKRAMEKALAAQNGIDISILHLPIVYGDKFAGALARLNKVPAPLRPLLFTLAATLKPTLDARKLVAHLMKGAPSAILTDGQADNLLFRLIKRAVDLAFALVILVFFWWLLLLIWLLVRQSSPGAGIFAQERLGQNARPFVLYKFRTMTTGTKLAGTHEVSEAAVTPIGKILRSTKIDELPQVWNILKGEISLIGPRPGLPSQTDLTAARKAQGVFDIRPGITGLAQVEGIDMSTPKVLAQRDAQYIALQGLLLEARIAIKTATGKGQGDHVRRL